MSHQPNIIYIFTDQQSANMMSCTGYPYLRTPAMDSLAARGVRFERAYCGDPVCVPSRFAMMTGRLPSAIGLRGNSSKHIESIPPEIISTGMGWLLREAGYETAYGGKVHLPKKTQPQDLGFDYICSDERYDLSQACADFVLRDHRKPYLLVASFINPHDICYLMLRDFPIDDFTRMLLDKGRTEISALDAALRRPRGVSDHDFFEKYCPPLPDNHEPQEDEPQAIWEAIKDKPRGGARAQWGDVEWRLHRWAYARLTERVDRQIARVLQALDISGDRENTVVVFSSDHGDYDGAHRLEHKGECYEEACKIPFIVAPGANVGDGLFDVPSADSPGGSVDDTHLISNGLDLIPTFCDYAGVDPPKHAEGRSIRPLLRSAGIRSATASPEWRDYLAVEAIYSRMIVGRRYSYALYDEGRNREQLYDLDKDPGQMRNHAGDPTVRSTLEEFRARYEAQYRLPTPGAEPGAES